MTEIWKNKTLQNNANDDTTLTTVYLHVYFKNSLAKKSGFHLILSLAINRGHIYKYGAETVIFISEDMTVCWVMNLFLNHQNFNSSTYFLSVNIQCMFTTESLRIYIFNFSNPMESFGYTPFHLPHYPQFHALKKRPLENTVG